MLKRRSDFVTPISKRTKQNVRCAPLRPLSVITLRDPVHGDIKLPAVCRAAMDTVPFQRMHGLMQLGASFRVFSGATHNRFQHSVGTAHLARQMVRNLRTEQPELPISDADETCVTLAALCHDLGHGPFSHTFEHFVNERPSAENNDAEKGSWTHEQASIELLEHMMRPGTLLAHAMEAEGLGETDATFVKEIIVGHGLGADGAFVGRPSRAQRFLYDIVNNPRSGLDVDKLDYLSRDSVHALGDRIDFGRLLMNARVAPIRSIGVENDDEEGTSTICFPEKLVHEVLSVFRKRFELHTAVYQHPAVKAYELMLVDVLHLADEHVHIGPKQLRLSEAVRDVDSYCMLKDSVLDLIEASPDPGLRPAQQLLQRMRTRDGYKCIGKVVLENFGEVTDQDRYQADWAWCSDDVDEHGFCVPRSPDDIAKEMVEQYYAHDDCRANDETDSDCGGIRSGSDSASPGASDAPSSTTTPEGGAVTQCEQKLRSSDIVCEYMFVHFGKKKHNPVAKVRFFSKDAKIDEEGAHEIPEDKYNGLLPRNFQEVSLRVFCKDTTKRELARCVFENWAQRNNASSPFPHSSQGY